MSDCGATRATVLIFGANTVASAALGAALFGDPLTLQWLLGASLILTGVALILHDSDGGAASPGSPAARAPPPHAVTSKARAAANAAARAAGSPKSPRRRAASPAAAPVAAPAAAPAAVFQVGDRVVKVSSGG